MCLEKKTKYSLWQPNAKLLLWEGDLMLQKSHEWDTFIFLLQKSLTSAPSKLYQYDGEMTTCCFRPLSYSALLMLNELKSLFLDEEFSLQCTRLKVNTSHATVGQIHSLVNQGNWTFLFACSTCHVCKTNGFFIHTGRVPFASRWMTCMKSDSRNGQN